MRKNRSQTLDSVEAEREETSEVDVGVKIKRVDDDSFFICGSYYETILDSAKNTNILDYF